MSNANSRDAKPVKAYGIEWKVTPWSFVPNITTSTAAPLVANVVGPISVTISGTGIYTCTALGGGSPRGVLVHACELPVGIKGTLWTQVQAYNVTVGSWVINCMTVGVSTAANFTATTGQVVHGYLFQQSSSYTR